MSQQPNPTQPQAQPDPAQDRAAPAMPKNIADLLYVVCTLLEYGRHLAATLESRAAAPGFSIIARLFGTANLRTIHAYLHRGILRAAALEALLRKRAQSGRDIVIRPPRLRSAPNPNPAHDTESESLDAQTADLRARRAQRDAPIDPDHLPTAAEIEAEVRTRSIGRSIDDICRDLGVVPGYCTGAFWRAIMNAIVFHDGSFTGRIADISQRAERYRQERPDDTAVKLAELPAEVLDRPLGFLVGETPVDPLPVAARHDVPLPEQQPVAAAEATGPPPEPLKLAA